MTTAIRPDADRMDRLARDYLALRPTDDDIGMDRSHLAPELTDFTRTGWAYHGVKNLNVLALSINRALGEVRLPAMPEVAVLQNIGFCNLRCPYCPTHGTDKAHAEFQSKAWTMSDERMREIGHDSFAYARQVSFSGAGENLLARNVEVAAELAHTYGCNMFLNTNGTVASKRRLRPLWGATHLRISLDGASPTVFEALRRGGNFREIMRNVRTITRAAELLPPSLRMQTAINFGICASNIREMPLMVDLAHTLGIRSIVAYAIETTRPDLLDEPCIRYRAWFDTYFTRMQARGAQLGIRIQMVAPPFEMAPGEPDRPMGDKLILPKLPDSYYEALPPFEQLVDFSGVEEEATALALDALEGGIERMDGPLNQVGSDAFERAADLKQSVLADLNRAYGSLTAAEHTLLSQFKDSTATVKDCSYLHRFLYYYPDGDTRPCCFEFVPSTGKLNGRTIKDIFNGSELSTLSRRFRSDDPDPSCAACPKWSHESARDLFPFDPARQQAKPIPPV